MKTKTLPNKPKKNPEASLSSLLKPYRGQIALLLILTIVNNGLDLFVTQIIARSIDAYPAGKLVITTVIIEFLLVIGGSALFRYFQGVVQTYAGEKVARDLRTKIAAKISMQDYAYIQRVGSGKLLTNLTADVDAVKSFISQAIGSIVASVFLIVGISAILLLMNWRLAAVVLLAVPLIATVFYYVFLNVRKLFRKQQEAIDWLNKVINESILGSALIRLLNSQHYEYQKFLAANAEARDIGLSILRLFSSLIPVIVFLTNLATLVILTLGGYFVINGGMTLGDFTAFNNYLAMLIFPIMIIGFMSNFIVQAQASYARIWDVLSAEHQKESGTIKDHLHGQLELKNVTMSFGEKQALKNVSFEIKPRTKNAIIGPTAAGKTQLLYLLTGLAQPTTGVIEYDGRPLGVYEKQTLHQQIGFVFQDSIIFNITLRENIAFSTTVSDKDLKNAVRTAELNDFIDQLPQGLNTIVSERGTTLSGGQKQRVMLARALALNPKVLFLDDFTARVDTKTEQKILKNVFENYPGITLISVTQKIGTVEDYDQIILLMEGDLLAKGKHNELMAKSPEYVQIYNSQQSVHELQS